ncbi:ATP-binding cassette domain-containing protein [Piscinibacter gummiphilus]|uniref:ATP-binding cassette domain-containing protein n=1 Tax=Piscinibacter gummiphilus TaxID=946333 RepID=A0ABZ0D2F9_9BURK|nr:ATP-binding cassette domain-containing protein [Piscinibacter gummiphilus]WOB11356.1 ATP-binding cassette domain-containing protein [Piscinibacter gummiphilus]
MIRKRYIIPEVVQTSGNDCGPAVIKSLMEGYGVPVRYDRIREACATDVDGTSFDVLESLLERFGFDTDKALVPPEDLLLKGHEHLPAVVITRLPTGLAHFIVLWERFGDRILVMDPAHGRRWLHVREILAEVLVHMMPLDAEHWRSWTTARTEFRDVMRDRLDRLGVVDAKGLLAEADPDKPTRQIAALDASLRSVDAMVSRGALSRGSSADQLVRRLFELATPAPLHDERYIPAMYWSAVPIVDDEATVMLRGVPTLRITGTSRLKELAKEAQVAGVAPEAAKDEPDLKSIYGRTPHPALVLWGLMPTHLRWLCASMLPLSVAASLIELVAALSTRTLLSTQSYLHADHQRLSACLLLLLVFVTIWVIDALCVRMGLQIGRHVDLRFRVSLLQRLPRLPDTYFRTRSGTDLADRFHGIAVLRSLPDVLFRWLRALTAFITITAGLVWLIPGSSLPVVGLSAAVLVVPFLFQARLADYDLRAQTHAGGLVSFYLDALIGVLPIRAHNAAEAMETEQERLVRSWGRAQGSFGRLAIKTELALVGMGVLLVGVLVLPLASGAVSSVTMLLLAYWALLLPILANDLALLWRRTATLKNEVLRLIEPLTVALESESVVGDSQPPAASGGVRIQFDSVTVNTSAHRSILQNVSLSIETGEHVAVVGASGAGKSSLVGLLLGWQRASRGQILIDGIPLTPDRLEALRARTAWVDPGAQIWNRSLIDNVRYGCLSRVGPELAEVLDATDLAAVLERMESGIHTELGEGGTLVSGGEGQRIRLARALYRRDANLVILDEPFRGLDSVQRKRLLLLARKHWHHATLICVTHNIAETLDFDRVLVVDNGQIAESGAPQELAHRGHQYRNLLAKDEETDDALWQNADWRRVVLRRGQLVEP